METDFRTDGEVIREIRERTRSQIQSFRVLSRVWRAEQRQSIQLRQFALHEFNQRADGLGAELQPAAGGAE